ncbi:HNH endonuclease [Paenibacillus sp. MMO-58]|uniref:HNH endonuclease n=1 Tax=Paenibacillus sp. MMO-58 TaxID=3081290 RepID=UPI0030161DF7
MRNLACLEDSPESIFLSIASSKNNPCKDILYLNEANPTNCVQNKVFKRYEEYKQNKLDLFKISNSSGFSTQAEECLKGCYTSNTIAMDWLYHQLLNIQDKFIKDKCPYCGINSPTSRDHYLPKELFPEFSVMSFNLIPCCIDCNTLKGLKWKEDIAGHRTFLHYYFDEIPNEIFLNANIVFDSPTVPTVEITLCPPNNSDFYKILNTHFSKLNIIARINSQVNTYVSEKHETTLESLKQGLEEMDLKRLLSIETMNLERNHGLNYWKAVINRGIIECQDFFEIRV